MISDPVFSNQTDASYPVTAYILSEKKRNKYQPPTLIVLDTEEIRSGSTNVPEVSFGILES